MRVVRRLAGSALAFVIGLLGLRAVRYCDRLYYDPDPVLREVTPAAAGLACEDLAIPTADGIVLPGWHLAAGTDRRGVVLHLHGNAANRANHWPLIQFLLPHAYDVIEFDYRGYGGAPGRPTRAGLQLDAEAALRFAHERAGASPLFVFGQSLGATLALVLAGTHAGILAGVVAEAPFLSHRAIAADVLQSLVVFAPVARSLAWLLVSDGGDASDVLDGIRAPVLLIHGRRDDVVPVHHSQAIAARLQARCELVIVEGGGHLDLTSRAGYQQRVLEFLDRCTRSR